MAPPVSEPSAAGHKLSRHQARPGNSSLGRVRPTPPAGLAATTTTSSTKARSPATNAACTSPRTKLLIRIAEPFGVSLDHLAFADRDNTNLSGIADRELLENSKPSTNSPTPTGAIVKSVLDSYITRHRIQQLTGTGEPAA